MAYLKMAELTADRDDARLRLEAMKCLTDQPLSANTDNHKFVDNWARRKIDQCKEIQVKRYPTCRKETIDKVRNAIQDWKNGLVIFRRDMEKLAPGPPEAEKTNRELCRKRRYRVQLMLAYMDSLVRQV